MAYATITMGHEPVNSLSAEAKLIRSEYAGDWCDITIRINDDLYLSLRPDEVRQLMAAMQVAIPEMEKLEAQLAEEEDNRRTKEFDGLTAEGDLIREIRARD
jgi:transglutaminase/protease-like cytokinesis protein 3